MIYDPNIDTSESANLKAIDFKRVNNFNFIAYYSDHSDALEQPQLHNHDMCEIYLHISGDTTFVIENSIYPVSYGDIIITRPHENHHAIFHTENRRRHYCVFFSSKENEYLFDIFFNRGLGKDNLIVAEPKVKGEIINYCDTLINRKLSELDELLIFLKLINAISISKKENSTSKEMHSVIATCIDYIAKNISQSIPVTRLAELNHISIVTLERIFKEHIGITPSKYILNQRLSLAESLLREGNTVSETTAKCGFSDDSTFIQTFKRTFGMTPLKYSKHSRK